MIGLLMPFLLLIVMHMVQLHLKINLFLVRKKKQIIKQLNSQKKKINLKVLVKLLMRIFGAFMIEVLHMLKIQEKSFTQINYV